MAILVNSRNNVTTILDKNMPVTLPLKFNSENVFFERN